jgi:hypothetical protein
LGISVITTEESYTSKIDRLALEPLCKQEYPFGESIVYSIGYSSQSY